MHGLQYYFGASIYLWLKECQDNHQAGPRPMRLSAFDARAEQEVACFNGMSGQVALRGIARILAHCAKGQTTCLIEGLKSLFRSENEKQTEWNG